MKKIRNFFLWSLVFLGLLLAFDLLMVRSTSFPTWLTGVQRFYVDFRGRLLNLTEPSETTIEQVIGTSDRNQPGPRQAGPDRTGPRYLYADAAGVLQFADSLQDVPAAYRDTAQPLEE